MVLFRLRDCNISIKNGCYTDLKFMLQSLSFNVNEFLIICKNTVCTFATNLIFRIISPRNLVKPPQTVQPYRGMSDIDTLRRNRLKSATEVHQIDNFSALRLLLLFVIVNVPPNEILCTNLYSEQWRI